MLHVVDVAVVWWAMKVPIQVSRDSHLANPTMGCTTVHEADLGQAVATYLKVMDGTD